MIAGADVRNALEVAARDALEWISDKVSAISTAGWVLLAIALVALIWAWAVMHASTRIGPIEVDDLKTDAKDVPLVQLSAKFRRILSQVGLAPPPAVPAGSPQANLITAIEAVAPQGAAIGKLLSILPTPPQPAQYKVSAVLSGADDPTAPPPPSPSQWWEVSYTVQPQNHGVPQLACTPACTSHEAALKRAAVEIYQAIAQSLPEVFPHWVRWRTPESLAAYLVGLEDSDMNTAATSFKAAVDASPYNALAALQLANVNERRAGPLDKWGRVYFQAQALARYRAIAVQWPTVVAARYRASVVSAELATSYLLASQTERDAVRAIVPFPGLDNLAAAAADKAYVNQLRDFGDRESSATVQLLHPLYTIGRLQRLRNQFEPTGANRRALRSVVRTSRRCVAMRRLNAVPSADRSGLVWRYRSGLVLRYRSLRMRLVTWTDLPWEARYNAVCFYALRLAGGVPTDARPRVVDHALHNLARAIRESGGELTQTLITADPDVAYFRKRRQPDTGAAAEMPRPKEASLANDRRWREVVELAQDAVAGKPVMTKTGSAVSSTPTVAAASIPASVSDAGPEGATPWTGEADPEAVDATSVPKSGAGVAAGSLLPDRPWGNPRRRLAFWLVASAILVVAAIVFSGVASVPVGLVAIVAVIRTLRGVYVSRLERRIEQTPRAARNLEEEPPNSPSDAPARDEASGGGPAAAA